MKEVCTKLQRIAELARKIRNEPLQNLSHNIDIEWLKEAYRRTRKDGAVGIDRQTAKEYEVNLESNLRDLLERAKSGTYRAPAVRRVRIPKGSGKETRPIGIPTFEDKVLQRAIAMILEAVYEQEFVDGSYGFRPKRSAHQALVSLRERLMKMKGGWVLELDIRKFFDTMDRKLIKEFLRRRVSDGVINRLVSKWLHAGVMEAGKLSYPKAGTPQGGVISPILANIFLHEVLDCWFEEQVRPVMKGKVFLIRYADDATLVFELENDAKRVMAVIAKRFAKYGLTLHPDKTRLINFKKPRHPDEKGGPGKGGGPETFDILGFTFYWGKSRKGFAVIQRKTASGRFSRALKAINKWCRANRHMKVRDQYRNLVTKLRGHYSYYGLSGNSSMITKFRYKVLMIWWKWLDRRSNNSRMNWEKYSDLLERYPLPSARINWSYMKKLSESVS